MEFRFGWCRKTPRCPCMGHCKLKPCMVWISPYRYDWRLEPRCGVVAAGHLNRTPSERKSAWWPCRYVPTPPSYGNGVSNFCRLTDFISICRSERPVFRTFLYGLTTYANEIDPRTLPSCSLRNQLSINFCRRTGFVKLLEKVQLFVEKRPNERLSTTRWCYSFDG